MSLVAFQFQPEPSSHPHWNFQTALTAAVSFPHFPLGLWEPLAKVTMQPSSSMISGPRETQLATSFSRKVSLVSLWDAALCRFSPNLAALFLSQDSFPFADPTKTTCLICTGPERDTRLPRVLPSILSTTLPAWAQTWPWLQLPSNG